MSELANPAFLEHQIENIKGANEEEVVQGRERTGLKMPQHNSIKKAIFLKEGD